MRLWQQVVNMFRGRGGEQDAPLDPATTTTRPTSSEVPDVATQDVNSSTGTTPNEEYVGRTGGDESGDVGLSGGEARTGHRIGGREGAARDE